MVLSLPCLMSWLGRTKAGNHILTKLHILGNRIGDSHLVKVIQETAIQKGVLKKLYQTVSFIYCIHVKCRIKYYMG